MWRSFKTCRSADIQSAWTTLLDKPVENFGSAIEFEPLPTRGLRYRQIVFAPYTKRLTCAKRKAVVSLFDLDVL